MELSFPRIVRTLTKIVLYTLLGMAVVAGIIFAIFDVWTVPGDDPQLSVSVEPTLSAGDVVLVRRSFGASDGDVVRCADPQAAGRYVVARVMGSTGDEIDFVGGNLLVNGRSPSAPSACDNPKMTLRNPANDEDMELQCFVEEFAGGTHQSLRGKAVDRDSKATVDVQHVYLVSDNRILHLDSRDFGPLVPSTCQRVLFRLWGTTGFWDTHKRLTGIW
jgi:signal peptidase I